MNLIIEGFVIFFMNYLKNSKTYKSLIKLHKLSIDELKIEIHEKYQNIANIKNNIKKIEEKNFEVLSQANKINLLINFDYKHYRKKYDRDRHTLNQNMNELESNTKTLEENLLNQFTELKKLEKILEQKEQMQKEHIKQTEQKLLDDIANIHYHLKGNKI